MNATASPSAATDLIPIAAIHPSPTNPRKRFDPDKLAHLGDTILAQGIVQRLLVRPSPTEPGRYECVDGERRLRAAQAIELAAVPAEIRAMSDAEVIAIQLVTGETGEPLSAFEEADGFEQALANGLHTVESIAKGIGRDPTYVSQRRRLLRVPKEVRGAVESGALSVSTASLIGSIPDELDRKVAAQAIMPSGLRDEPLTYKQAQALIRERWMVGLRDAPFSLDDDTLGGPDGAPRACRNCPYLEDKGKGGVVTMCTQPRCYRNKCAVIWDRTAAKAKAAGQRVLTDEETAEVFEKNAPTVQIAFSSPYVAVDSKPTYRHVANEVEDKNLPTWRELLETAAEKKQIAVPTVLARDRNGKQWELVQLSLAIEAARAVDGDMFKKVPVNEAMTSGARFERDAVRATVRATDDFAAKKKAEAEAAKKRLAENCLGLATLHAALAQKAVGCDAITEALLDTALEHAGADGQALFVKAFGLRGGGGDFETADAIAAWFRKGSKAERHAAIPLLLVAQAMRWKGIACEGFVALAAAVKFDIAGVQKEVAAQSGAKAGKAKGKGTKATKGTKVAKKDKAAAPPAAAEAIVCGLPEEKFNAAKAGLGAGKSPEAIAEELQVPVAAITNVKKRLLAQAWEKPVFKTKAAAGAAAKKGGKKK